jgi:CheY-like chemotaxis protein
VICTLGSSELRPDQRARSNSSIWGKDTPTLPLILIIDDDEFYSGVIEQGLGNAGYAVAGAYSGAEGIARYRELSPNVVLIDMVMPEMDGAEVIGDIRAFDEDVRIIAVSGDSSFYAVDYFKLATQVSADAVVRKLDSLKRIIVEVQSLLKAEA